MNYDGPELDWLIWSLFPELWCLSDSELWIILYGHTMHLFVLFFYTFCIIFTQYLVRMVHFNSHKITCLCVLGLVSQENFKTMLAEENEWTTSCILQTYKWFGFNWLMFVQSDQTPCVCRWESVCVWLWLEGQKAHCKRITLIILLSNGCLSRERSKTRQWLCWGFSKFMK